MEGPGATDLLRIGLRRRRGRDRGQHSRGHRQAVSVGYTRQKYPDWANKRITPPSPLQAIAELKEDKAASADPVELGAPGEISSVSRVEMPSGYTPKLQPPVDIVRDFAEFHATYAFNGGVLTAEYRLVIKSHELPASRRDDYQTFVKSVNKNLQV